MTKKSAKANPLQPAPKLPAPATRPKTNAQRQIAPAPKTYSPRGRKKAGK